MLSTIDKLEAGEPLESAFTWRPLGLFNLYRLLLCCLFLGLTLRNELPSPLGESDPELFFALSAIYLAFSIVCGLGILWRRPAFHRQLYAEVVIDIVLLTLIMHTSGGVDSGVGMLLVVTIAAGSLLARERNSALVFATLASLAILAEQVYAQWLHLPSQRSYAQAAMLAATFFAIAILAYVLARRTRESEALATRRAVDLANMVQLADYIIQRMQTGILVLDSADRVILMNKSAGSLLGLAPEFKRWPLAQASPELAQQLRAWRETPPHEPVTLQPTSSSADILPRFAELGAEGATGTLIYLEDMVRIAQQVQHLKLASLGKLAASIAHEIRNPLAAISHAGQLLGESAGGDQRHKRLTQIIFEQSRRVNNIIENVLRLSRRDLSQLADFELRSWLEDFIEEFAQSQNIDPAHIALEQAGHNGPVRIDPGHLHQILWNLCQNGLRYTTPRNNIKLKLREGALAYSPYLDVIDFGPGVAPESVARLFEPFFTTEQKGTGLGLYIAHELCECNQARLSYSALPEGGSCFRIIFANPQRRQES